MKLYSDTIGCTEVYGAFSAARLKDGQDIRVVDMRSFRPRGPEHNGVEFYAESLHGTRATGHHAIRAVGWGEAHCLPRAASWTAYGYVIARLFALDPKARIGQYNGRADFIRQVTARVPRGESSAFLTLGRMTGFPNLDQ